jgi:hypothetical protein
MDKEMFSNSGWILSSACFYFTLVFLQVSWPEVVFSLQAAQRQQPHSWSQAISHISLPGMLIDKTISIV